ncbi:hypothetical protein D3C87_1793200 [compost metagenome]
MHGLECVTMNRLFEVIGGERDRNGVHCLVAHHQCAKQGALSFERIGQHGFAVDACLIGVHAAASSRQKKRGPPAC